MKNLYLLSYSALIIACSFIIIFMISSVSDSIQFQEIAFYAFFHLSFAVVPILVIWIYCILKYYKTPKKAKISEPFAKPSSSNSKFCMKTPKSHFEKEETIYYRTFLLLGIPVGIFVFLAIVSMTLTTDEKPSSNYNESKSDLRAEAEQNLTALSQKLEKYVEANPDEFRNNVDSKWHNVFESELPCFETENKALMTTGLFSSKSIADLDPVDLKNITPQTIYMRNPFIVYEPYEYKIISINPVHIKIRYNTKKQLNDDFDPGIDLKFTYNIKSKKFIAASRSRNKFSWFTDNSLYSAEIGNLEYDTKLKVSRFMYGNWWDNLKENQKWVFYVADYLVMFLICFLMIFQSSRLQKIRNRRYELKFSKNDN